MSKTGARLGYKQELIKLGCIPKALITQKEYIGEKSYDHTSMYILKSRGLCEMCVMYCVPNTFIPVGWHVEID